jgi:uncharacterized protein YegP (UPF0339 family)
MGKYTKYQDKGGEYRFNLKADNGQVILSSEGYKATSGRDNGIASVRKNCGDDARYERLTSKSGKAYFNLKSTNGQVIGSSQMYESEAGRDNGIESVKKNGTSTVEVEE